MPANFVGQKYLLLAKYNFFDPVPWVLGTLCHLSWEKKYFSGTCFVYGYSPYINGKYKNKAGKEESITSLKDQITIKKETVLKEGRVECWSLLHSIAQLSETQAGPATITGGISLLAGVSTLQSFYWVYYHYCFLWYCQVFISDQK